MEFDPASVIPPPPLGQVRTLEDYFEVTLPDDYKQFVATHNGSVPLESRFDVAGVERMVERFLPIIQDVEDHPLGWLDLEVVASQLDTRLTDNEEGENINLVPIAALLAGDFIVLD